MADLGGGLRGCFLWNIYFLAGAFTGVSSCTRQKQQTLTVKKLHQVEGARTKPAAMNADEKSKYIKPHFPPQQTISKSLPGAAADKSGSQERYPV